MLELSGQECQDLAISSRCEWLVTNGIGGYANGTVAGMMSRHYHGLLIAALRPPVERMLLFTRLDETVIYQHNSYDIYTNQWGENTIDPHGYRHLVSFRLEGAIPVWTFAIGEARLEKRIWMEAGENTTYVRYTVIEGHEHLVMHLKAIVNYRSHHNSTVVEDHHWQMSINPVGSGLKITAYEGATPFYILNDRIRPTPEHIWYHNYWKSVEYERGQPTRDDHLYAGRMEVILQPSESLTVVASIDPAADLNGEAALNRRYAYEESLLEGAAVTNAPPEIEQLILAADQFIVSRPSPDNPNGKSILAGFPWFSDWGRDTMIALPGLTLATGRPQIAADILRAFAGYVDQGMLPNRFPDDGETPEYNTVDATLWYFEAIRAYHAATKDDSLINDLYPVLQQIIHWHLYGTRYGIHVDTMDGLLYSGEEGIQLTWMDVKIGDWVVTPRTGKAVEINALWYNALCSMADFALCLGFSDVEYTALARQVRQHFGRFWNGHYCYDVVDSPSGDDATLRPNQLIAASLHYSPLEAHQAKAVVEVCEQQLLTPRGLRSLAPNDRAYAGRYFGDQKARDAVYHQGTVWAWLIGPFIEAHLRVYSDKIRAKSLLMPLLDASHEGCIGSISEIYDGNPPHISRGCYAQAWSVSEIVRIWRLLEE